MNFKQQFLMTEEAYVSFETAKLLKKRVFYWKCTAFYNANGMLSHGNTYSFCEETLRHDKNCVSCPTQQMAMRWLREAHNIIIEPESVWNGKKWEYLLFIVTPQNADSPYYEHNPYKSYEECVEAAIKYCLENLI